MAIVISSESVEYVEHASRAFMPINASISSPNGKSSGTGLRAQTHVSRFFNAHAKYDSARTRGADAPISSFEYSNESQSDAACVNSANSSGVNMPARCPARRSMHRERQMRPIYAAHTPVRTHSTPSADVCVRTLPTPRTSRIDTRPAPPRRVTSTRAMTIISKEHRSQLLAAPAAPHSSTRARRIRDTRACDTPHARSHAPAVRARRGARGARRTDAEHVVTQLDIRVPNVATHSSRVFVVFVVAIDVCVVGNA